MDEMLRNKLADIGVDVDKALEYMMGNEAFYIKILKKFISDENFDVFRQAMNNGDTDTAFRAAHTLKGISSNLSITSLDRLLIEITDALRSGNIEKARIYMPEVLKSYTELASAVKSI